MNKPRVFVTRKLALDPKEMLGPVADVDQHDEEPAILRAELLKRVHDVDALLPTLADRVNDELLDAAPKLKIVTNHAVGYDNIDVPACTARGVWVTNTPGVLTDCTADLAWTLILALVRRVREGERMMREGKFAGWAPTMLLGRELRGATLGLIGHGRIATAVEERAKAFGMKVIYHSRSSGLPLPELLEQSDIVSIHCPLNAQTRHLIGSKELAQMKRGAQLINTARGPIIDEAALVKALESGHLGGAGLDVFEEEPLVHQGLVERDDVVLLPHLGSATVETRKAMARIAMEQIGLFFAGKKLTTAINEP